jgi:hypothetical protein
MTNTTSVNAQMQQVAEYALRVAAEKFGKSLDYTENSLASFEALLQQAYEQNSSQESGKNISKEGIQKTARVWGSYLGELMRRKWGGEWVVSGSDVKLTISSKSYSPIQQVYQRITIGQQYDIKKYIASIASDMMAYGSASVANSYSAVFPPSSPKNSAGNKYMKNIANFWKTGKNGKQIIIIVAVLLFIFCCCAASLLRGSILSSSPTYKATKTAEYAITQTWDARPTGTPIPSNTPKPSNTPVTITPSPTLDPYYSEMLKRTDAYQAAYNKFGVQNQRMAENPYLLQDMDWKLDMGSALAELTIASEDLQNIPNATPRYQNLDQLLNMVGSETIKMINNYTKAVDNLDASYLDQVKVNLLNINQYLQQATDELTRINSIP